MNDNRRPTYDEESIASRVAIAAALQGATLILALKVADQRDERARQCFAFATEHGATSPHGMAYTREGFFWLRAARAARNGDLSPLTYNPATER